MTNLKVASSERAKAPVRSPEREALSVAISRRDAAQLALTAGQRALGRADGMVEKATERVEAARTGVATANEQRAAELAQVAAGGAAAGGSKSRNARAEQASAEDELEAIHAARARVKATLADLEDAALHASNLVIAAVDVVLRTAAEGVLAEAQAVALRLRELMPVLRFMQTPQFEQEMLGRATLPMFSTDWDWEIRKLGKERADRRAFAAVEAHRVREAGFDETREAIRKFIERPSDNRDGWHRHPAFEAWRACRAALMNDADAPLPALLS